MNEEPEWFEQFAAVLVDEVHLATAKSIKFVVEACTNAWIKIGLTGSLDGSKTNEQVIRGLFGNVKRFITTHEMIGRGIASQITINVVAFDYPEQIRKDAEGAKYHDERDVLINFEPRNRAIAEQALNAEGNSLVLVNFRDHGKQISELVRSSGDAKIFYIDGEIDGIDRKAMYDEMNTMKERFIAVATYKTLSTGVNVKTFHNIVFAHPAKGRVRVLQSIGRGLRKHRDKKMFRLFDIVDDLMYGDHINYGIKHFQQRMSYYKDEKFPVVFARKKIGLESAIDTDNQNN